MDKTAYTLIESHMLARMRDSAHDRQHVYRVLDRALDIAETEAGVDYDVLIAACLLHDIGRDRQYENPALDHAAEGGNMAYDFLLSIGWTPERAARVRQCVFTHRYRCSRPPESLEAKILFDADKLDATGVMGVARTLLHQGQVGEPLESFAQEYQFKLAKLYDKFYTARGRELAETRRESAARVYEALIEEAREAHNGGPARLIGHFTD